MVDRAATTKWSAWWSRWWPAGLIASGCVFAIAYWQAWTEGPDDSHSLFWIAVALMVLTVAALIAAGPTRASGFVSSLALGALLFLPKLLHSPTFFNYFDEVSHVRAVAELSNGAGLFQENPLNKAVEFYPGLAAATGVLHSVTGLSSFVAGNLLIVTLHALLLGALFLLYERVAGSPQVALLAVAVYAANPAFVFFESYFAYESFALPLAVSAFVAVVLSDRLSSRTRTALLGVAIAIGLTVVVSHHVTSWVLALILLFSGFLALLIRGRRDPASKGLLLAGITVAAGVALWLVFVAPYTSEYVAPTFSDSFEAVGTAAEGDFEHRETFQGDGLPIYERYGSYLAVFVLAGAFLVAGVTLLRRRALFREHMTLALAVVGAAYFVSLPIAWLTSNSAVTRIWEFAFLGVAPLVAIALAQLLVGRGVVLRAVATILLFVLFLGGITNRTTLAQGLPGPYEPSADPRSMTGDLLAASRWFREHYGTDNVVTGDHAAFAVFGAYGGQQVVSGQGSGARPWLVFFPRRITQGVLTELDSHDVEFLVIDRRISTDLPRTGWYYSSNEPGAGRRSGPVAVESLDKFERSPAFETVYDNGNIVIYRYLREAGTAALQTKPRARLTVPTKQNPLRSGSLVLAASCLFECRGTLTGSFSIEGSPARYRLPRTSVVVPPERRKRLELRLAQPDLEKARQALQSGREVRGRVHLRVVDRRRRLTRSIGFILRPSR